MASISHCGTYTQREVFVFVADFGSRSRRPAASTSAHRRLTCGFDRGLLGKAARRA